jgi:hypothetical protein
MGLLRLVEAFAFSDWQDCTRYRQFLQADRRHWAWFWLQRNSGYLEMAAVCL